MPQPGPILFYDGECGLCDFSVRWTLEHDSRRIFRFAPLQGSTYAALPISAKPQELGTVVLYDDRGLHERSTAALRTLKHIGGLWNFLASIALVIPRPIRDGVYDFIAARRLRWFGGSESCRLPSRQDREQLLP